MVTRKRTTIIASLILLFLLPLTGVLFAQVSWIENSENAYYYSDEGPIGIEFDSSFFSIHFETNTYHFDIQSILDSFPTYIFNEESIDIYLPDSLVFPDFNDLMLQYDLSSLGATSLFPGMKVKGTSVQMTSHLIVKKKADVSLNDLASGIKRFDDDNDVEEEISEDVYTIEVDDPAYSFEFIQYLFNEDLISWGQPDFVVDICSFDIDPLYDQQFQLNNTGQIINGEQILAGIDVNMEEAWDLTTGANHVFVAILDDGIEAHEDLSFVAQLDYTVPAFIDNDSYHGMSCAGLIAGSHNSIGLKGVAPDIQLVSQNILSCGTTVSDLSKSFYTIADMYISVVNNSWGFTTTTNENGERGLICDQDLFPSLSDAIHFAAHQGRGGLGTTIIFSAGNIESDLSEQCITYPANLPDVISVGSILPTGEHASYSPVDSDLDFVIPSSSSDGRFGVVSLDRMNEFGINDGNYNYQFGGTSASAPILTGIVALMISVHPVLTRTEVYDILENTVYDRGVQGRDEFFGLGIPNAFEAVKLAQENFYSVNDPCPSSLSLSGQAFSSEYTSSGLIESSQVINQLDVKYMSEESILLEPLFQVEEGFVFEVSIELCNH